MKSSYRKFYNHEYRWIVKDDPDFWVYRNKRGRYYRKAYTTQELRYNEFHYYDEDCSYYRVKRPRRMINDLEKYRIEAFPCRDFRRAWKEFTKHKHQWELNIE